MLNALQHVVWEPCMLQPARDRGLEAYARSKQGLPNPALPYFAPVPWLARAVVDLHPEYGLLLRLPQDVADLVALVVSQENSCRFCYAAVRALLWGQGMSKERIERIEQDMARADLPPQTVAAMEFGRSQSRTGPTGAEEALAKVRSAGFSEEETREIAFAVASTDFSNRVHTIPAIPARQFERMPDQLIVRLMRPLLGRILRSHRARGEVVPFEGANGIPYARLVGAFAGSPIAPALGRTLRDMWASPHLSRRAKLLMFAVVARGLDCRACAPDHGHGLRAEGLEEPALAQVLTHLDSPALDPLERQLVAFARETIWYEPAALQRRARALRTHMSNEQFLEAIGVAALANGLCRMGAMLPARA